MKMIETPVIADPGEFPSYVSDCQRGKCELPYHIPVPSVPHVQLYVDFGDFAPLAVEFTLQDFCNQAHAEQVVPSNYVIGVTPEGGFYGVFKFFNSPVTPVTSFVIHLSALVLAPGGGFVTKTFFSEIMVDEPCNPLVKIKSCHPESATETGFDINNIYYGLPTTDFVLGIDTVRYFHIVYARTGKLRELPPRATFTSNLIRNFRTQVDQNYIVETELVPKWYKDYFLGVYSRGAISVNDGPTYLVDGLAFEALNDDDLIWKPYANVKKTTRLYYGCDDGSCAECCTPTDIVSQSSIVPFGESESETALPEGSNYIRVTFDPCEPTPAGGWRFLYRPLGTNGAYRGADERFFGSPIDISDDMDVEGTEYEGILQSDCGNGIFSNGGQTQTAPGGGSDSDSGGGGSESDSGVEPETPNWWIHGGRWDFFAINLTGPIWLVGPLTSPASGTDNSQQGRIDWPAVIAANPGVQVNVSISTPIEGLEVRIRVYDVTDSVYIYDNSQADSLGVGFIPVSGHEYLIEAFDGLDSPEHILF